MTPVQRPRGRRREGEQPLERVSTTLPPGVYLRACQIARERRMTVSELLRTIITRALALDERGGVMRL